MAEETKKIYMVEVHFVVPVMADSEDKAIYVARKHAADEMRNGVIDYDATEIRTLAQVPSGMGDCLCWNDPEEKPISYHLGRGSTKGSA